MKKLLSLLLALSIIFGLFGCITLIASAEDDATWKSDRKSTRLNSSHVT